MGPVDDARPVLIESLLLQNDGNDGLYTADGSVDINGNPVLKQNTGNWKACFFILGTECCERLAFFGISTNLVTFLTTKLHQGIVSAAKNATIWQGTCYLTPLFGAVLADAYLGKYWTIASFSAIYVIGMCALTLSVTIPSLRPSGCIESVCPSASVAQNTLFLSGLYLVSLGTGGIKPCVSPFGADQFDDNDFIERVKKGSFFNWFYFAIYIGILVASTLLVWVQDNIGWGLGFGIPALFMGFAIVGFLSGTSLYRFQKPQGSAFTRIFQVLVASCCKWNLEVPKDCRLLYGTEEKSSDGERSCKLEHSHSLKFLDKAAVISDSETSIGYLSNPWRLCTVTQVEETKALFRLFPIWVTGIVFGAVYAQVSTLFVEQATMMDTTIGSFTVPPASVSTFDAISVLFLLPIYDRLFIPFARKFTGKEKGVSELQRMGIGLGITVISMICAALVEANRLRLAEELDLVDKKVKVPMSVAWQIPQYFFMGASEIFQYVGQLEFFYEESPDSIRSLCTALMLSTLSLGYYLNSLILTVVTWFTRKGDRAGWIPDNLNEGHLDYFFGLLALLSFINLLVYLICAKNFKLRKVGQNI